MYECLAGHVSHWCVGLDQIFAGPSLVVQTQAFFSQNFCSQDDAYIILQLVLGK